MHFHTYVDFAIFPWPLQDDLLDWNNYQWMFKVTFTLWKNPLAFNMWLSNNVTCFATTWLVGGMMSVKDGMQAHVNYEYSRNVGILVLVAIHIYASPVCLVL